MKHTNRLLWGASSLLLLHLFACSNTGSMEETSTTSPIHKEIVLKTSKTYQLMDGFGVNITPAQWRDGNLKSVIDILVDDLGSTLIRFDCYGKADWLDPMKQLPDKTFPPEYLEEVYTSKVFVDAWETFRYFNSKGIEPIFNISGRIPSEWAGEDGEHLVNFESYAEMAVSMLKWARFNENLRFSLFMPYNETNLGFPEGPFMKSEDCVPVTREIVERMKSAGLDDVKLIVMGDSHVELDNIKAFLDDPSMKEDIYAFSGHTYGNGFEEDSRDPWPWGESIFREAVDLIEAYPYNGKPLWITEYGDLDQTGEIEYEFAWRSTRRLIRFLNDGVTAAQAWDAFDNLHEHDGVWAYYGLLKTDSLNWTYTPKKRYYAAKQAYKFVKPGFMRIEFEPVVENPDHVYLIWQHPLKNMEFSAFISPERNDLTILGLNRVEGTVVLKVSIENSGTDLNGRKINHFMTDRNNDCVKVETLTISNSSFTANINERSIFTLTTLE
jgi:hypothetical protein